MIDCCPFLGGAGRLDLLFGLGEDLLGFRLACAGHGLVDGLVDHGDQALFLGDVDFHLPLDIEPFDIAPRGHPQFFDFAIGDDAGILDFAETGGLGQLDLVLLAFHLLSGRLAVRTPSWR